MPRRKLRLGRKELTSAKTPKKNTLVPKGVEVADWLKEHRQLLMPAEVASILRIHTKKVYDLPIPRIELSPRRTRYDPLSVRNYLQGKTTGMIDLTGLASFCTSTGMRGGFMRARDLAEVLRMRPATVGQLSIPSESDGEPLWEAAQVGAWMWAHRAEPSND